MIWPAAVLAAAAVAGCRTPEAVQATDYTRLWNACLRAAATQGFQVVESSEVDGFIVGRRDGESAAAAELRIYVQPSQAGYEASVVIRSSQAPSPQTVRPPRTDARTSGSAGGRYAWADGQTSGRQFAEEQEVLERVRALMKAGPERTEQPAAPLP